jgi:hypothetical protein
MSMDQDFDFTFAPSGTIYCSRAIKLDTTTQGACFLGSLNSPCIGITPQQTEVAPGMIGNQSPPFILAQPGSTDSYVPGGLGSLVPVYGEGRRCLIDIDPNFGGQIKPGDLIVSSNSGYGTRATQSGAWNQWVIGIALSVANSGQSCNVKVTIFPWLPTGS